MTQRFQTVWLARHATRQDMIDPAWSRTADRPFDSPLAEEGKREAKQLAQRLAGEDIDVVLSSPFLRALQTAEPVAEAAQAPLRIEPGLCEWLRHDWFTRVPEFFPGTDAGWQSPVWDSSHVSPTILRYPEEWSDVARRMQTVMSMSTADGANAVLIGHGASIVCAVAALLGRAPETNPEPPRPASLFKLVRIDEHWHMELDADVSHLNFHSASDGH